MRNRWSGIVLLLCGLLAPGGARGPAGEGAHADTDAVWRKGIDFLLGAQAADGSWGHQRGKAGITGIVLEGLTLAPAAMRDDRLAAAAEKAAAFIVGCQQTEKPYDGAIFEARAQSVGTYSTSIAVVALTKRDREKYLPVIEKAVDWLKRQQASEDNGYNPENDPVAYGGFAYGAGGGPRTSRPDLSNTWMALDALKASGLVADDDPVWARAKVFVQRCQHATETNDQAWASDDPALLGSGVYVPAMQTPRGGGEPRSPNGYGSMTYAMLLSFLWLDMDREDPAVSRAVQWLSDQYSVERVPRGDVDGQTGLYYYYRVMAKSLTAYGRKEFAGHDWAADLTAALAKRQREDGSFVNTADRWGESDPTLVTGYSLTTLGLAQAMAARAEEGR